jgi:hypothetical protein
MIPLTTATLHRPGEPQALVDLIGSVDLRGAPVVEIGVYEGRTSRMLLAALPQIESYIGIEVEGAEGPIKQMGLDMFNHPRFQLWLAPRGSRDISPNNFIPDGAAAVFIDGDHTYEGVMHDQDLARRIVRPGGIIVWHDYGTPNCPGVKQAVDTARDERDIRQVDDTTLVYERI